MGRKSIKDLRQKEIVSAFYKIAKKEGIENASIAKTANLMGIAPSLVLHYFNTKELLIESLVEDILHKYLLIFEKGIDDHLLIEDKLNSIVENLFSRKWNRLFDDGVSYSCYSLSLRDKKLKRKFRAVLDKLREQLATYISAYYLKKKINDRDPKSIADYIFFLVDGIYYYLSLVENKSEYDDKIEDYKKNALMLIGLPIANK